MAVLADTHLHSGHSHDAETSLALVCEEAIAKGLKVICTTEHLFLDPRDVGYGYFDMPKYFQAVNRCRDIYKDRLKVLSGVEFSEPQLFVERFEKVQTEPFDMITGALHWLEQGFFGEHSVLDKSDNKALLEQYYKQMYEMVSYGGFDTLAHIDLIKRYVKVDETRVTDSMKKVIQCLVDQNIALELNTSTIRKDGLQTAAAYAMVDTYLELGGTRLTVGSDAHNLEDIGADFDNIPVKYEPYIGYFEKRQFANLK